MSAAPEDVGDALSRMSRSRTWSLTLLALLAFAGNSLLCRLALKQTTIDPATFTAVRLVSGALVLALIVGLRSTRAPGTANWWSACALTAYAIAFSLAYVKLPTGTGALLLFGAVQLTMIGHGLSRGERLYRIQSLGILIAFAGLVVLLLPGIASPSLSGSILMLVAGASWGVYSLRGRAAGDPTRTTAGNFARAVPLALVPCAITLPHLQWDATGLVVAIASGALASGLGYVIWYAALKGLKATEASAVQLAVPVIAALGGRVVLHEPILPSAVLSSVAVLGGIALVVLHRRRVQD